MTLPELLDRTRALYVEELARVVAETEGALAEVALRGASGSVATEGALDLGMRIDLVVVRGEKVVDRRHVATSKGLRFEPIHVRAQGLELELHPFSWDGFRLELHGGSTDLGPFASWFAQWFGDDVEPGADGLRHVVHFLSDPEVTSVGRSFEVDLGSAPVEAFVSLVDACARVGATRVVVRSGA